MPSATIQPDGAPTRLPFPPITTSHILACSYHSWQPKLRSHTPKARVIPLSQPFLDYLRADGILLPSDTRNDDDSGYSDANDSDDDPDPALNWREIHDSINTTIKSLGGKIVPKLNWSAPKDATWISSSNDMTCQSANDVYLLLKSSDFITHDLEHAFDGCSDADTVLTDSIPYHLVLRKVFNLNPSLEFRCFVRNRRLLGISQREMNHFDFLFGLRSTFKSRIENFLNDVLLPKFSEEENFVFDVYIPPPHEKVWLIDINPWAPRTDPLLFSWLELLRMPEPLEAGERRETTVRLQLRPRQDNNADPGSQNEPTNGQDDDNDDDDGDDDELSSDDTSDDDDDDEEELPFDPEFRLVQRDDPEAYQFTSTKYSAHKMPRDVVDASMTPSGMKDMMDEWKRVMEGGGGDGSDED